MNASLKIKVLISLLLIILIFTTSSHKHLWTHDVYQKNDMVDSNVDQECFGETLPNGVFCLTMETGIKTGGIFSFDGQLCKNIETIIQNSSIVDLGAGLGHYGKCLLRESVNINIKNKTDQQSYITNFENSLRSLNMWGTPKVIKSYEGYDGAVNVGKITNNFVKPIDLSVSFDLGKRFDWVMSLEVGEHIPKEAEDIFLGNLIRHSCKGIILSWAVPNQGGLQHINNQPNEYVISKMKGLGFSHDSEAQAQLRTDSLQMYWFKDTLMVFKRITPICKS